MLYLPAVVVEVAAMLTVVEPAPGAAMLVELKLTVTPAGAPLAVKLTAELKLLTSTVVRVSVPLLPWITLSAVAEGTSVKVAAGAMVSVTDAALETPPPVAVSVMGYEPVATELATVKLAIAEPEPGEAMLVGLKTTVKPAGAPLAVKATTELKPS
jgi:hypothetical protein